MSVLYGPVYHSSEDPIPSPFQDPDVRDPAHRLAMIMHELRDHESYTFPKSVKHHIVSSLNGKTISDENILQILRLLTLPSKFFVRKSQTLADGAVLPSLRVKEELIFYLSRKLTDHNDVKQAADAVFNNTDEEQHEHLVAMFKTALEKHEEVSPTRPISDDHSQGTYDGKNVSQARDLVSGLGEHTRAIKEQTRALVDLTHNVERFGSIDGRGRKNSRGRPRIDHERTRLLEESMRDRGWAFVNGVWSNVPTTADWARARSGF